MLTSLTTFGSVPHGVVALPLDPVIGSCLLLGYLVACAAALWLLGRPDSTIRPKHRSDAETSDLDKAA